MCANLKIVSENAQMSWPNDWDSIKHDTYKLCPRSNGRTYKIGSFSCRFFSISGWEIQMPCRGLLSSGYPDIDDNEQHVLSLGFATRADIKKFEKILLLCLMTVV